MTRGRVPSRDRPPCPDGRKCSYRGMRGIEWTDSEVLGAYGRDELNDNGERLLIHAIDNKVALLNTYYAMPHLLVIHRTRFRVVTEKRPSTGLTAY